MPSKTSDKTPLAKNAANSSDGSDFKEKTARRSSFRGGDANKGSKYSPASPKASKATPTDGQRMRFSDEKHGGQLEEVRASFSRRLFQGRRLTVHACDALRCNRSTR